MDTYVSAVIIQVVTVLCVAVTTEAEIKVPFGGIPELSKVALYLSLIHISEPTRLA